MSRLVVWSRAQGAWLRCRADEITWLDRDLLSGGQDRTLHRAPRCPALRYVHHRWELFSRDVSHQVYVAPFVAGTAPGHHEVQAAAEHVLAAARASFEPQPVRLDAGPWLISVGTWVLPISIGTVSGGRDQPTVPPGGGQPTKDIAHPRPAAEAEPAPDAVPEVTRYFQRNPTARLAIAYYYQNFVRGGYAPQAVQMAEVAVALDLSSEGAVSEYKKELQRRIWHQTGHQRDLAAFLLANGLVTVADVDRALRVAAANEASGRAELARKRLRYSAKRPRDREQHANTGPQPRDPGVTGDNGRR
jgi:hypothetical protein